MIFQSPQIVIFQLWSVIEQVLQQDFKGNIQDESSPAVSVNGAKTMQKVFLERRTTALNCSDYNSDLQKCLNSDTITKPTVTVDNPFGGKQCEDGKRDDYDLDVYLQKEIQRLEQDQKKCVDSNYLNTNLNCEKGQNTEQNMELVNDLISNILKEDKLKAKAKPHNRKILPKTSSGIDRSTNIVTDPISSVNSFSPLSEKDGSQFVIFPSIPLQEKKKIFTCTYEGCEKNYVKSSHLKVIHCKPFACINLNIVFFRLTFGRIQGRSRTLVHGKTVVGSLPVRMS